MARGKLRFLYTGIRVKDLNQSIRFYEALGMRIRVRGTMEHGGEYVHLGFPRSPVRLELNYYPKGTRFYEPFRKGSEFDHLGFYSSDPEGELRRLKKIGGRTMIHTFREGRFALGYVSDPNGVCLEVFGPTRRKRSGR